MTRLISEILDRLSERITASSIAGARDDMRLIDIKITSHTGNVFRTDANTTYRTRRR